MHVFVSYAKRDVAVDVEERLRILSAVDCAVTKSLGRVFVDELHNYAGGHTAVTAALNAATCFCVVQGPSYLSRDWTRWEYGRAAARSIPIYEIGMQDFRIRPCGPPWQELRHRHRAPFTPQPGT